MQKEARTVGGGRGLYSKGPVQMIGLIRSVSLGLAPDVSSVCGAVSVFVLSVQTSYEVSAIFSFGDLRLGICIGAENEGRKKGRIV